MQENSSRRYCLYRHFDADDALLYLGISISHFNRLAQHKDCSSWFSKIVKVTLEFYDTRDAVLSAEKNAIINEKPKYNIHHNYKHGATFPEIFDFAEDTRRDLCSRVFALVYSRTEAALELQLSEGSMRRLIEEGKIKTFHQGNSRQEFITGWAIIDYLEKFS